MAVGDALSQTIKNFQENPSDSFTPMTNLNFVEIGEFSLLGLLIHGPLFHYGQQQLDKTFGSARTARSALMKTVAGQTTLFPTWLCCFLMAQGLAKGFSLDESVDRLKQLLPKTVVNGFLFWTPLVYVNFLYINPSSRMLFMNSAAVAWNSYLSLVSKAPPTAQ